MKWALGILWLSLMAHIRLYLASRRVLKIKNACVRWVDTKICISVKTNQVIVRSASAAESSLLSSV